LCLILPIGAVRSGAAAFQVRVENLKHVGSRKLQLKGMQAARAIRISGLTRNWKAADRSISLEPIALRGHGDIKTGPQVWQAVGDPIDQGGGIRRDTVILKLGEQQEVRLIIRHHSSDRGGGRRGIARDVSNVALHIPLHDSHGLGLSHKCAGAEKSEKTPAHNKNHALLD
jgi:hypothetical protein